MDTLPRKRCLFFLTYNEALRELNKNTETSYYENKIYYKYMKEGSTTYGFFCDSNKEPFKDSNR